MVEFGLWMIAVSAVGFIGSAVVTLFNIEYTVKLTLWVQVLGVILYILYKVGII